METRNCIYTTFYTNLKSYDGNDTEREYRIKLLDYCVRSYKKFNPDIEFIIDYIDDEIKTTSEMFYDKSVRLKNLNKDYNILWVDGDTICIGDLSEIFLGDKPKARFWGNWDGLNLINGGLIYYPKNTFYNYFDEFSKEWIKVLSELIESKENFTGPMEQKPITNYILNSYNKNYNYENFSIFYNLYELKNFGILFDDKYNINSLSMYLADTRSIDRNKQGVFGKKVLHLNASHANENTLYYSKLLIDYGVMDCLNNYDCFKSKCRELNLDNRDLVVETDGKTLYVNNKTNSIMKVILSTEKDVKSSSAGLHMVLNPNNWLREGINSDIECCLVINTITGEIIEV